jgi:hypothetical protein
MSAQSSANGLLRLNKIYSSRVREGSQLTSRTAKMMSTMMKRMITARIRVRAKAEATLLSPIQIHQSSPIAKIFSLKIIEHFL